ncbi:hypothetical protein UFOVP345_17 [uncultured Caudovirales phage]|uniref:Uncharacterized protein n=1 Tax=uncultured Caudovirales phage TaxID=2100421 RepID=A0A6J5NLQ4_9CAUD|nr:hypothetical protein UFOVP345_17 [uncultured Caudovirales phage]CAB4160770.1 hypothetical protein UFOVP732_14 [uncultured Caudovirales phage]
MDTTILLLVLVVAWAILVIGASSVNQMLSDFLRHHFPNDNPPRDN